MPHLEAPAAPAAQRNRPFFLGMPLRGTHSGRQGAPGQSATARRAMRRGAPASALSFYRREPRPPKISSGRMASTSGQMKQDRRSASQCEDCKRKKKRCPPDHLIEELPGEESNDEEEGEAEREEDPYAHIHRVDLPGNLGAGIRDHATGSRYKKKTMRAPPQPRAKRSSSSECSCSRSKAK